MNEVVKAVKAELGMEEAEGVVAADVISAAVEQFRLDLGDARSVKEQLKVVADACGVSTGW